MSNSGAVIAFATVVYAAVTLALLLEARRTRLLAFESHVDVVATPWDEGGMVLSVTITNYGPAIARDLDFSMSLRDQTGAPLRDWRLREAVFPVGRHRTVLPGVADRKEIDQLIAEGFSPVTDWTWLDGRGQRRQGARTAEVAEIAAAYRGSGALLQPDPQRDLRKMRQSVEQIDKTLADVARRLPADRGPAEPEGMLRRLWRIVAGLRARVGR